MPVAEQSHEPVADAGEREAGLDRVNCRVGVGRSGSEWVGKVMDCDSADGHHQVKMRREVRHVPNQGR